jgi:hypothetical protein
MRLAQQVIIPDVVDMATGMQLVIANIASVVLVAVGGYLAYLVIRKGLDWVLDRQDEKIRRNMEQAALDGDWERYGYWGDRFESLWGEDARAYFEDELNNQHELWRR